MPLAHTCSEVTLRDGAKGLLVHVPGAGVTKYGIHFRTDSSEAGRGWPHQAGHIVEHIAFGLTTDQRFAGKEEFVQELEKNGAYANATTSSDGVSYHGYCAVDEWQRIVGLRRSAIERPKFDDGALEAERGNVVEELKQYVGNNGRLAWELSRKALTGGAWMKAVESIADARAVTLEDVKRSYDATHTRANMRFVIAGDLGDDPASAAREFDGWDLAAGERLTQPSETFVTGGAFEYDRRESLTTVSNTLTFAIDRAVTPLEAELIKVINHMLFNSHTSRVLGKARDRGICYSMRAGRDISTSNQTSWVLDLPVGKENLAAVFALMADELGDVLRNGFTREEFERARSYDRGRLAMSAETAKELYDDYSSAYFKRDEIMSYDALDDAYASMTDAGATELLGELLAGHWSIGGVGAVEREEYADRFTELASFVNGVH